MSELYLDSLLSELLEIRFSTQVPQDEIPALIEKSIQERNMFVLLTEAMSRSDVKAVEDVLSNAESVLNDYGKAVKNANSVYLTKLLTGLKKRLEKQKSNLQKAKDSDDIRDHVKYKDAVSDTGILIVAALRSIRNGVNATAKLVQSMGDDAFNPAGEESEESQGTLSDFSRLIGQALADNSLGKRMKPEALQQFESELAKQVEKPSVGRGLGKFIAQIGSKSLRIDSEKLLGSMLALSADELQELDRSIKQADSAVQQATEAAEETSEELQDDSAEGENSDTTEEASEVEAGQFYRYTTTRGADRIVRVENVLDDGNVQLRLVIFNGDKLTTGSNVFALKQEKLGDRLTDQEVKDRFDTPGERVQSIVGNSETANSAIENLSDIPLDELVKAASQSGDKPKVSREQGLKAFSAMAQNPKEAAFLYATVRKAINQDVGYEMFESKQEVDTFDRWLTIAGIDKGKNET